jgi:hypothetical protein
VSATASGATAVSAVLTGGATETLCTLAGGIAQASVDKIRKRTFRIQ